jgi:hypothetical protein
MLLAWMRKIILQQNLPTAVVPTSMSSISRALAAGIIALGRCGLLAGVRNMPGLSGIEYPFPMHLEASFRPRGARAAYARREDQQDGCVVSVQ